MTESDTDCSKEQVGEGKTASTRPRPPPLKDDYSAPDVRPSKRRTLGPTGVVDLNESAISYFRRGEFDSAQQTFLDALSLLKTECLETTPERALSLHHDEPSTSSYVYQRMDFDEGMNVYSSPETIRSDDYPVSVLCTLRFNIGQVKCRLGEYDAASRFYDSALQLLLPPADQAQAIRHSSLGCALRLFYPSIVPLLHSRGFLAYRNGNLDESMTFYKAALKCTNSVRGCEDLEAAVTLNCLGVLAYHKGSESMDQAMAYFHDAHRILSLLVGPCSSIVATTLNNLGRVMVQKEDLVTALLYYEQALSIRRDCLGTDHIDYAATAFNAGQSHHQLGKFDRAIFLYREFLRVASNKFSTTHRDVAVVLSGIAQIHQKRKENDKAKALHEESLRVGRAALGDVHSEVAMLLNRVGNFYFESEDYDSALRVYKEGLVIERKVLEKSHPNIVVTLSNIGEIYRQKSKYKTAIKYYTQAMELQKIRHGPVSAEVAGTLNVLGLIHDQRGNSTEALSHLQNALVMRRTVLGENHLDVSSTLTYLGTLFYRRKMISIAMRLFSESLRIRSAALGMDHRDVSFALYNIGLCHQIQGNHVEAIRCFRETLRIETLVLGSTHRDVGLTLSKLGEAYKAEGDLVKALECLSGALSIQKQLLETEDSVSIARTLVEIGNIQLAMCSVDKMMSSFTEAARMFLRVGRLMNGVTVSQALALYATELGEGNCAAAA